MLNKILTIVFFLSPFLYVFGLYNWYLFSGIEAMKNLKARGEMEIVSAQVVVQDSILQTGWYFISSSPTNYKRRLDNSTNFYFLNPKPIATKNNFKSISLFHEKNCYALLIRLDSNGSKALNKALESDRATQLGFIVNDSLLRCQSTNDPQFAHVDPKTDYRIFGEVLAIPCNYKQREELIRISKLMKKSTQ